MLKVATPFAFTAPEPSNVVPSLKTTLPLALPLLKWTVAVKVTVCPDTDGLREDTTTVPVLALPTVSLNIPALLEKLPSPR